MDRKKDNKFENTQKHVRERLSRWLLAVNKNEYDRKKKKAVDRLNREIIVSSLKYDDNCARFSDISDDTLYYCNAFFIDKSWIMQHFHNKIKL